MSRRKLVWIASGVAIVLVVAISIIPIIPRPSQETEAESSEEESSEEETSEEEPSEETEGEPTSALESPWAKIAGWKLEVTVTAKGSWEKSNADGTGHRGTYTMRYSGSTVLTNPLPTHDDSDDTSDTSQFFSSGLFNAIMWGLYSGAVPGMPGVQAKRGESTFEFEQQEYRVNADVCGEEIGSTLIATNEIEKAKGNGALHAGLLVNPAKRTYRFSVADDATTRKETRWDVVSGGCSGPGRGKPTFEEGQIDLGGSSPEGKIEFRDLPLPSGPAALSGTRPLPPGFFLYGPDDVTTEATVSWTFSPLGDR